MSDQPQIPPCAICLKSLNSEELNLNRRWHFDCEFCSVCGQSMSGAYQMIESCLASGRAVAHSVCANMRAIQDLRENIIPCEQKHLDALNDLILSYRHVVAPPATDVDLLRDYLVAIREHASMVSDMLAVAKVKLKISDIENSTIETRERIKKERTTTREKAEKEQITAERSAMLQAERQNPWLRARRKSIESLSAYLPLEQATKMVDDASIANGKDPLTGESLAGKNE